MSNQSGYQLKGSGPEIYEAYFVPALMGECAVDLVQAGNVKPGDRVLDVGCGTGVVTREAAKLCGENGSVSGVDVNKPMVDFAAKISSEQGFSNIEWKHCDASELPFEDNLFDVVLCQQGLQFMPDKPAAMSEMARVLSPGGSLAVSVWKISSPFGTAMCDVVERHFGEGTTDPWQVAYALGDRDELRNLSIGAGLTESYVKYDIKIARHSDPESFAIGAILASPLAGKFEEKTEKEQKSIAREIIEQISDYMDDGGLACPTECHTLTARK